MQIDKNALCEKIRELYPDIGECGMDLDVAYDEDKKTWIVDLKKDGHQLHTHLENEDADACMLGEKCVGLGFQIAELRGNVVAS